MKRGQVVTYLIIGLVIIVIAILMMNITRESSSDLFKTQIQKFQEAPKEIELINQEINGCLNKLVTENLILIGKKGGIYELAGINVLYNKSLLKIPTTESVGEQLTLSIKDTIYTCKVEDETGDIEDIEETIKPLFNITYKDPIINAQIDNKIIIIIDWPITISKDNLNYKKPEFTNRYNVDYKRILSITNQIIEDSIINNSLCLNCINDISDDNLMETKIEYTDKDKFIISLIDNKTILDNKPYIFVFSGEL